MSCVVRINLVSGLVLAAAERTFGGVDLNILESFGDESGLRIHKPQHMCFGRGDPGKRGEDC